MLKTVIAVEADLASRIAIRYVCLLGRSIDLAISTIHVLQTEDQGNGIGTGWVRRTWEDAVSQRIMNQVTQLVKSEQTGCRVLEKPLFLPLNHNRDEQIAEHMRYNRCDLFVEGVLHRFEPDYFMEKIGSGLYRELNFPILMVKNVIPLSKRALLVSEGEMPERAAETFLRMFPIPSVEMDLLVCRFDKESSLAAGGETSTSEIDPALSKFKSEDGSIKDISVVEGSPSSMAGLVRDHFLIVTSVPGKNSPMAELLSKSPCSMLFLPRHASMR
jgi:hypothetical protein